MEQKPLKAFLVQFSRLVAVIFFEILFAYVMKTEESIYYAFIAGDLVASVIGIINFIERYRTYGRLERGEITTIQAGIGEVSGDKVSCIRKNCACCVRRRVNETVGLRETDTHQ